jgi:starvation-inducible DNA-binding protein
MTQVQNLVPKLGIDERVSKGAAESLVQLFADELNLQFKTWNLSYNIVGPRFSQMRELLCENTKCLKEITDNVSIQIRNLGHRVPMVTEVIRMSKIEQPKSDFVDEDYVLQTLLKDHETILQNLFKEQEKLLTQVKEYIVQDFILDVIKQHRKMAWLLRSHLEVIPPSQQQQQWGTQQQQQQWGQQQQPWGQERQYQQGQFGQQGQQGQFPQQGQYGQQGQQGVGTSSIGQSTKQQQGTQKQGQPPVQSEMQRPSSITGSQSGMTGTTSPTESGKKEYPYNK